MFWLNPVVSVALCHAGFLGTSTVIGRTERSLLLRGLLSLVLVVFLITDVELSICVL